MWSIRLGDACEMYESTTKQICFGQVREYKNHHNGWSVEVLSGRFPVRET